MSMEPRPADHRQRVIARLEDDKQLLRAPGWHEKDIAREWGEVQHAPDMLLCERGRVGEYSELDKPKTDLRDKDTSLRR